LPLAFVALMTMILILSSVTMVLAVEAGHRMDKNDVQKWLLWTILFGSTFLGCQAWEWSHFISGSDKGMLLPDGTVFHGANLVFNEYGPVLFADLFFFITGFHGTHVFSGIILLIIMFINTVNGVYQRRGPLRNGGEGRIILALCRLGVGICIYLFLPGIILN
jgi:cytochrome c oxidase subunit 3